MLARQGVVGKNFDIIADDIESQASQHSFCAAPIPAEGNFPIKLDGFRGRIISSSGLYIVHGKDGIIDAGLGLLADVCWDLVELWHLIAL